jgi:hypothetical protein
MAPGLVPARTIITIADANPVKSQAGMQGFERM